MTEETLEDGSRRTLLKLPPALAPIKTAILPLVKKDGLPELAHKILDEVKFDFETIYDEKDAVGRRYRRQDALGTPFCVTIDHQTKDDYTVTLRERDSMLQERISIEKLKDYLMDKVSISSLLKRLSN